MDISLCGQPSSSFATPYQQNQPSLPATPFVLCKIAGNTIIRVSAGCKIKYRKNLCHQTICVVDMKSGASSHQQDLIVLTVDMEMSITIFTQNVFGYIVVGSNRHHWRFQLIYMKKLTKLTKHASAQTLGLKYKN